MHRIAGAHNDYEKIRGRIFGECFAVADYERLEFGATDLGRWMCIHSFINELKFVADCDGPRRCYLLVLQNVITNWVNAGQVGVPIEAGFCVKILEMEIELGED